MVLVMDMSTLRELWNRPGGGPSWIIIREDMMNTTFPFSGIASNWRLLSPRRRDRSIRASASPVTLDQGVEKWKK
jgi:hypothetical protein